MAKKAKKLEPNLEKMSADEIRQARSHLGTDEIRNRHINYTCRRGGKKMFGLVHFINNTFYLQTKELRQVMEAMEKEGYRPKINKDGVGTAWGAQPTDQQVTQPKTLTLLNEHHENRPARAGQPIKRGAKTFYVSAAA